MMPKRDKKQSIIIERQTNEKNSKQRQTIIKVKKNKHAENNKQQTLKINTSAPEG